MRTKCWRCLPRDQRGQSGLEYAILAAVIGVGLLGAWNAFGGRLGCVLARIEGSFGGAAEDLSGRCSGSDSDSDGFRAAAEPQFALPLAAGPEGAMPKPSANAPEKTELYAIVDAKEITSVAALGKSSRLIDLINSDKPVLGIDEGGTYIFSWGKAVSDILDDSKTLQEDLKWARSNLRGGFRPGIRGDGTFYDPATDAVVIDQNELDNATTDPEEIVSSLAHEISHARSPPEEIDPSGRTKEEYIAADVDAQLRDESRANLRAAKIVREIKEKSGIEVEIPGSNADEFAALEADKSLTDDVKEARGAELFGGRDSNADGDYDDVGEHAGECPSTWACNTPCASPGKHDPKICTTPDDNYTKYYTPSAQKEADMLYKDVPAGAKAP